MRAFSPTGEGKHRELQHGYQIVLEKQLYGKQQGRQQHRSNHNIDDNFKQQFISKHGNGTLLHGYTLEYQISRR
jgi:hypothetical protein